MVDNISYSDVYVSYYDIDVFGTPMRIELPQLPYPVDGLEPFISARTLQIHHSKHPRAHVDTTNANIVLCEQLLD